MIDQSHEGRTAASPYSTEPPANAGAAPVVARDGLCQDFSIVEGGPLYRLTRAIGLQHGPDDLVRVGLALAAVTWIPLAILTAIQPVDPPALSFARSFGTHARLLVAIPLFFLAERLFDARVRETIRLLVEGRVVPRAKLGDLEQVLRRIALLRDTWAIEGVVLFVTAFLIWQGIRSDLPMNIPSWRTHPGGGLTAAGWWYTLVGFPVIRFLLVRWAVRFVFWWWLLLRLRLMNLNLVPTHPDRSGGLGGLGVVQTTLAPVTFSVSAIIAGTFAEEIFAGVSTVQQMSVPLAANIVAGTLVTVLPLGGFIFRLIELRQRGLLEYGRLGMAYVRQFDQKWVREEHTTSEPLLGSADIQSLADLSNGYNVIDSMRWAPMSTTQLLTILIAAALPVVPFVLFIVPLEELILRVWGALLHL